MSIIKNKDYDLWVFVKNTTKTDPTEAALLDHLACCGKKGFTLGVRFDESGEITRLGVAYTRETPRKIHISAHESEKWYVIIKTLGRKKGMKTRVRTLDGLPIEEPVLDDEGLRRQKELSEMVVKEYEESGTLTGQALNEKVIAYETEIAGHVLDE